MGKELIVDQRIGGHDGSARRQVVQELARRVDSLHSWGVENIRGGQVGRNGRLRHTRLQDDVVEDPESLRLGLQGLNLLGGAADQQEGRVGNPLQHRRNRIEQQIQRLQSDERPGIDHELALEWNVVPGAYLGDLVAGHHLGALEMIGEQYAGSVGPGAARSAGDGR